MSILSNFGDFNALLVIIDKYVCFLETLWWLMDDFGNVVIRRTKLRFVCFFASRVICNICGNDKSKINWGNACILHYVKDSP